VVPKTNVFRTPKTDENTLIKSTLSEGVSRGVFRTPVSGPK
jgi:hypothetical protein